MSNANNVLNLCPTELVYNRAEMTKTEFDGYIGQFKARKMPGNKRGGKRKLVKIFCNTVESLPSHL